MSTADYMTEQERQDLRDAGRGHLIDGSPLREKADRLRKLEREEQRPSEARSDGDQG